MSINDKSVQDYTAWDKMNVGLKMALANAKDSPEDTNIVWEVNNLLCMLRKPDMLEFETVMEVERMIRAHMEKLEDPVYLHGRKYTPKK